MKSKLMLKHYRFNTDDIRVIMINNQAWFFGNDVASILGYQKLNQAIHDNVDADDRKSLTYKACRKTRLSTLWGRNDFSNKILINESGVYALIFNSHLPAAHKFKHWVTHAVLPSIRKTGSYHRPMNLMQRMKALSEGSLKLIGKVENQHEQIVAMVPNYHYGKFMSEDIKTNDSIKEYADKFSEKFGVDLGQNRMYGMLRYFGYLCSNRGTSWNAPRHKYVVNGWFVRKPSTYKGAYGDHKRYTTRITPKGEKGVNQRFSDFVKQIKKVQLDK